MLTIGFDGAMTTASASRIAASASGCAAARSIPAKATPRTSSLCRRPTK